MMFFKLNLHDVSACLTPLVPRAFTVFPCAEKITVSFNICPAALE